MMSVAEFAKLEKAMIEVAEQDGLCRTCFVVAIEPGDIYCEGCTLDVLEFLARGQ